MLGRDDVEPAVDVHSELDRRAVIPNLVTGSRRCGHPFAMNTSGLHKTGELTSSPTPFHVIYALQRTRSAVMLAASCRHLSLASQPARQLRESLSLGALGLDASQ